MHIQFIKNIQFTRLIKADGHLREFNFRKLTGFQDELFTVDVSDDRGNRIMFRMRKEDGTWKIIAQPLPEWVASNENTFHDIIEEELRNA
jgi:hypothetical protein